MAGYIRGGRGETEHMDATKGGAVDGERHDGRVEGDAGHLRPRGSAQTRAVWSSEAVTTRT